MSAYEQLAAGHRRFLDEYLIDLNGKEAAIRAGYKPKGAKVRASEFLARPDVKAALAEKQSTIAAKLEITAERVVGELARLGFSNMLDYITIGADGLPVTDFSALTRDQAAAVTEITVETRRDTSQAENDDAPAPEILKVKFKLADKRSALESIGKHLGIFKERTEHSGPNGGPIPVEAKMSNEDAARLIAFALLKAGRKKDAANG